MTLFLSFLLLLNWTASDYPSGADAGIPPGQPTPGQWVAGYRVYWRTSADNELVYTAPFYQSQDVGNVTHWETSQVENVIYYYQVCVVDIWGREREASNLNWVIYVRDERAQPK